jgi:hypothetical protein
MNEHPPIPPKHPRTIHTADGPYWLSPVAPASGTAVTVAINDPGEWRSIVAAMYETAWMREAERLECLLKECRRILARSITSCAGDVWNDISFTVCIVMPRLIMQARANARAWAEWGRQ